MTLAAVRKRERQRREGRGKDREGEAVICRGGDRDRGAEKGGK